jgi:hypothetical protein
MYYCINVSNFGVSALAVMLVNNCSRCVSIFGVSALAVMIVNNCSRCVSIFGVPALAVMIVNNCSRCVVCNVLTMYTTYELLSH